MSPLQRPTLTPPAATVAAAAANADAPAATDYHAVSCEPRQLGIIRKRVQAGTGLGKGGACCTCGENVIYTKLKYCGNRNCQHPCCTRCLGPCDSHFSGAAYAGIAVSYHPILRPLRGSVTLAVASHLNPTRSKCRVWMGINSRNVMTASSVPSACLCTCLMRVFKYSTSRDARFWDGCTVMDTRSHRYWCCCDS